MSIHSGFFSTKEVLLRGIIPSYHATSLRVDSCLIFLATALGGLKSSGVALPLNSLGNVPAITCWYYHYYDRNAIIIFIIIVYYIVSIYMVQFCKENIY